MIINCCTIAKNNWCGEGKDFMWKSVGEKKSINETQKPIKQNQD